MGVSEIEISDSQKALCQNPMSRYVPLWSLTQEAGFQSLMDGIDTTTTGGKLVFHIMGALAGFERDLISERTKAGMKAAQKRGKHIGRPKALSQEQIQHMHELLKQGKTQGAVVELLGVSANTVGRRLAIINRKEIFPVRLLTDGRKIKILMDIEGITYCE